MMEQRQNGRNIRLVAIDLDGTLLSDDKKLSARNEQTINRAISQGVLIVPATGRTISGIPKVLLDNKNILYAICSNGASIMDLKQKKSIYRCDLTKETVVNIIKILRPLDPILDIFADGQIYTEHRNMERLDKFLILPNMIPYIYNTRICVDDILDFVQTNKLHIEKVNLFFRSLDMKHQVEEKLMDIPQVHITSSSNKNIEINNINADKGLGLKWLAGYLGLAMEQVMACGDSNNDTNMLNMAGLAVAMGNGTDAIKHISDYVTLSNEDSGVAAAIEKYVL